MGLDLEFFVKGIGFMATTFKDHSATEIEETIGKALGELLGSPVSVNISKTSQKNPGTMAALISGGSWGVDLEMHVADNPPLKDDAPSF